MQITTSDLQAIKGATAYSVSLGPVSTLECIQKRDRRSRGVFSAQAEELRYSVTLDAFDGRAHFYAMYPGGTWDALRLILRVGDELTFHARDNSNQYEQRAMAPIGRMDSGTFDGLHHDELVATIRRNGKAIVRDMVLMSSVCPDNSARAIRQYSSRYSLTA